MKNKTDPTRIDAETPEWTDAMFKRARRAQDVLPKIYGPNVAERMLRPRGRPKSQQTKRLVSLRLSPDVLDIFKKRGPGWQTRIDETLRKSVGL